MAFKQVNEFRKKGLLEDALKMAQDDYEFQVNNWTASALFWVYYDMAKSIDGEELETLLEQMKPLYGQMEENEFAANALAAVERRTNPLVQEVNAYRNRCKKGEGIREAFTFVKDLAAEGRLDAQVHDSTAWIIYYQLRSLDAKNPDKQQIVAVARPAVELYLQLQLQKPSMVHSQIMRALVNLYCEPLAEDFYRFFLAEENLALQEDDWSPFGEQKYALAQRISAHYVKALLEPSNKGKVPQEWMAAFVEEVAGRFPEDVFALRSWAQLQALIGKKEEALKIYRNLLKVKDDFYLWSELAEMEDDEELQEALLSKAMLVQPDDKFTLRIRLRLSCIYIRREDMGQALFMLDRYAQVYQENGWHLNSVYDQIRRHIPQETQPQMVSRAFLQEKAVLAEAAVFSDIPQVIMVPLKELKIKDKFSGKEKRKVELMGEDGTRVRVSQQKFRTAGKNYMQRLYRLRLQPQGDRRFKVISFELAENVSQVPWLKDFEGNITIKTDRKGQQIGFVDGCFVPPALAGKYVDGMSVKVRAVASAGKWMAIRIANKNF